MMYLASLVEPVLVAGVSTAVMYAGVPLESNDLLGLWQQVQRSVVELSNFIDLLLSIMIHSSQYVFTTVISLSQTSLSQ